MVKKLPQADQDAIAQAVLHAERTTHAELVCVVSPASDPYQQFVFLYGFLAASLVDLGLWMEKIVTAYPWLLLIQLGVIVCISLIPALRHLCIRLVPTPIRHRRAAHRAFEEYLIVSRHAALTTPIVLLYVSLAERYAHILPSRTVRQQIPDSAWKSIMDKLINSVPTEGIRSACLDAITQASGLLALHFPKN